MSVCNDVEFSIYTVKPGDKLVLEPDEAKTRFCIVTSKVQARVDEQSFRISSDCVVKISPGAKCVVRHPRADSPDGAIIHVISIST